MATASTDVQISKPERGRFARAYDAFLRWMETHHRMSSRLGMIEALEAKTDAELAAMGLRRENIVHHVFRDLYYV